MSDETTRQEAAHLLAHVEVHEAGAALEEARARVCAAARVLLAGAKPLTEALADLSAALGDEAEASARMGAALTAKSVES